MLTSGGLPRRFAIAAAALATTLHALAAMAETRTLAGTVAYRERIALPRSAVLEVKLVDVSRADAPSATVAETSVSPEGQVPIPYRLPYDDTRIVSGRSYALQARIVVDGQPWFATTTRHSVFAGGVDKTDILVERVRATPDGARAASPAGKWLAEDIRGGGVIDRLQVVLEIAADGAISGTGGCNRMTGKATISEDKITFGPIAATRMACTPAAMEQEGRFFVALRDARAWRIDPTRRKLALLDENGKAVVVLAPM